MCTAGWSRDNRPPVSVSDLFSQYCIECHSQAGELSADVDLGKIQTRESLIANPILLSDLINVIEYREMPPEGQPDLTPEQREGLLAEFKSLRRKHDQSSGRLGRVPLRRMNRFQYHNAVIDLFDLQCELFTLPERMMRQHGDYFQPASGRMPDVVTVGSRPLGKSQLIERRLAGVTPFPQDLRAENGFDNRGDHLTMSPLLLQSFLSLGQSVTQSPDFTEANVGIWNRFFARPKSDVDLRASIESRTRELLTRAFRRPVDAVTLDRYVRFAEAKQESGETFPNVMKAIAAAVISSPKFLYHYDEASQGRTVEPLSDWELASRLALFLWGSLPDAELLQVAEAGTLREDAVLMAQVERMLDDPKLKRFCDSFPAQWLQLERIISSVPDPERYPGFYFAKYRDSMHMMIEPLLLFETVLIENRSLTELIDSSFTYRSGHLMEAYGGNQQEIAGKKLRRGEVTKLTFARFPIQDRRFGGLITNAAVMTMTSGSQRTKPITRGAWLATVVFNDPPDPPPADVPPLDEDEESVDENLTLRERLSQHRERSDCRGCHEQIDPLGFALENFDAIGRWRDQYENGRRIDMSGVLFREHEFANVVEFKDAILEEKDRFTQAFARHVLSFALAREIEPSDAADIERIAKTTAADHYRIQTLLKQVVLSKAFRQKLNPRSDAELP